MALLRGNLISRSILKIFSINGQISSAGYSRMVDNPTAGIIVIGDEILKAQVKDSNSHHICSLLYDCGVKVKKISVIGDEVDLIAEEMVNFSNKYTYVITSGGIGPTHDDVTFEALAKAFDDSLAYRPELVEVVKKFSSSQDVSSPGYKLAYIPSSANLKFGKKKSESVRYPCINLKNVYVFPGSPMFMQNLFNNVYEELFATNKSFVKKELYLVAREELFADALTAVAKEFPQVTFGSYPTFDHSYYSARVTIESGDKEITDKAVARFLELAPSNSVINYDADPLKDASRKYKEFVTAEKQGPLYEATLASLKQDYGQRSRVAICFDGGIETTVLIHLAHICNTLGNDDKLQAVYLREENPFEDVDLFVEEIAERYNLQLHVIQGSAKKAIGEFRTVRPEIEILLLGSKGDETEKGFRHSLARADAVSQFRIKVPLTNWTYEEVWNFARSLSLPYCKLYDRGYTSLGDRSQTQPNPKLLKILNSGRTEYYPAYMLKDVGSEKAGGKPGTRRI